MLEWLKNILGDGYTEEIDKQVSDEISKAYAPRADLDSANEAKAAAEAQLADANKTIAGYKDIDIDAIRQSAADWQAKAEQAQKDADARVAAVQFDARLDGAIGKRRGRSAKAIKALLDMDALRGSKNQRVLQLGLDKLSTYGIMHGVDQKQLREYVEFLIDSGYLYLTQGEYPVLRATPQAREVLFHGETVEYSRRVPSVQ